jgi:hypothetical protein
MRKTYSIPESYADYVKNKAQELDIAESDMLRRIIDWFRKNNEKSTQSD